MRFSDSSIHQFCKFTVIGHVFEKVDFVNKMKNTISHRLDIVTVSSVHIASLFTVNNIVSEMASLFINHNENTLINFGK